MDLPIYIGREDIAAVKMRSRSVEQHCGDAPSKLIAFNFYDKLQHFYGHRDD